MNRLANSSRLEMGLNAVLLVALVTGCGDTSSPTQNSAPMTPGAGLGAAELSGLGPAPVLLGAAGTFVILSKSGISNVPTSAIVGNIGVSPIAATAITGFALVLPAGGAFSKSSQVTGNVYAPTYAAPTPANLTKAIGAMQTAYVNAAGRKTPNHTELGGGHIGGLTLAPGLYKWSTAVSISTNVTLHGGASDVWIFQIEGGLTQASATKVILTGGALARNVFWQVAGVVAIGTTAHMEGEVLAKTAITLKTGASVNGGLYAQTAVTLASNRIVKK
jgi:Ice-binding-like